MPDFWVLARPLYNLLQKNKGWDWNPQFLDDLDTLKIKPIKRLGPMHLQDLFKSAVGICHHHFIL